MTVKRMKSLQRVVSWLPDWKDVLFFVSAGAIGLGLSMWSVPLAVIYAGAVGIFVAYQGASSGIRNKSS